MSRTSAFSLLAVSLAACTAKGADGYFVLDNTAAPTTGACTFTGEITQPSLSQGLVSTLSPGYFMAPLLQSRLNMDMNQSPFYKTITVQGARIDLTGAATMSFQQLAAGDLPPQGTANVPITAIPASVIQSFAGHASGNGVVIQATVTYFGQVGGSEIDATPFLFGVTISDNAVVNLLGDCPSTGAAPRLGNVCNPFQDGIVDCCCNKFCSNAATTVCNSAGDCGAGKCSISGATCILPTDCAPATDGVCNFPNTCNPGTCSDPTTGLVCPARTQ